MHIGGNTVIEFFGGVSTQSRLLEIYWFQCKENMFRGVSVVRFETHF